MTIDINTVKQKIPLLVNQGQLILPSQVSGFLNSIQAMYKFSNRVIYSDFRNTDLTGYYFNNAPWYYINRSSESNWVGQICKLLYKPVSPLPGSNLDAVTTAPINPVAAGVPNITLYVSGCNIQYFIQIERVTVNSTTGVITYTGDTSRYDNNLPGVYDPISPWLSTYDTDEVRIGLPDNTVPGDKLLIDFYVRGSNDDEDAPGFLGAVALWETQLTDFPQGSY
jgi:hypothetical protein